MDLRRDGRGRARTKCGAGNVGLNMGRMGSTTRSGFVRNARVGLRVKPCENAGRVCLAEGVRFPVSNDVLFG